MAIIALPLSIALAIASGVNPEQGLYTAVVAGFFISFLGGSRVQIGGPTAAFVVIIYGIIAQYGMAGLTLATLMAGLMLIIMGLLRFGDLIKFIPKTITLGFTLGIAVGIVAGQVKDFLGLEMKSVPAEFLEKLLAYGKHLSSISWADTCNWYLGPSHSNLLATPFSENSGVFGCNYCDHSHRSFWSSASQNHR